MPMAPIGHNGQARPLQYNFQSEHCSLDSDYNGMQAVSSVTAPGASDGQVVEKEEKEKEEEEEGPPPPPPKSNLAPDNYLPNSANSSGSQSALSQSTEDFERREQAQPSKFFFIFPIFMSLLQEHTCPFRARPMPAAFSICQSFLCLLSFFHVFPHCSRFDICPNFH